MGSLKMGLIGLRKHTDGKEVKNLPSWDTFLVLVKYDEPSKVGCHALVVVPVPELKRSAIQTATKLKQQLGKIKRFEVSPFSGCGRIAQR